MKNPLKLSARTEIFPIFVVVASLLAAFFFYQNFAEIVASHWNFRGEVDGYSSKALGAFMLPGILVAMYALFALIPLFDPRAERYIEFRSSYLKIRNAIMFFLLLIYLAMGAANLGYIQEIGTIVPLLVGLLFIYIGNLMGKLKTNWYVGLRNPWTLSDADTWNKANRFSGKAMMISGLLIGLDGFLADNLKLPVFIAAIAIAVIVPTVYSFILYNRQKEKGIRDKGEGK